MRGVSPLEKMTLDLLIGVHLFAWLSFIGSVITPTIISPIITFRIVLITALGIGLWAMVRYAKMEE